jgi:hypothetical protein
VPRDLRAVQVSVACWCADSRAGAPSLPSTALSCLLLSPLSHSPSVTARREPVVASDGHSYERLAIEKWLKSKTTSPRTGKTMDKFLTPNLNLQKLIHDMIEEGGASLYTKDSSDVNRLFYVYDLFKVTTIQYMTLYFIYALFYPRV